MSMARLLRAQGKEARARDSLAAVYRLVHRRLRDARLAGGQAAHGGTGARSANPGSANRCDAGRMKSGAFSNSAEAAREAKERDSLRRTQAVPAALSKPPVDMADLVARALAVLDESRMAGNVPYREATVASSSSDPIGKPRAGPGRTTSHCSVASSAMARSVFCRSAISTFNASSPPFWRRRIERFALAVGAGLQPVLQEDGKAVVDLYCIEYRKTDIGPYNEVGLTVRAKAPGDPIAANYVATASGHHRCCESSRAGDLGLQQVRRRDRCSKRRQDILHRPSRWRSSKSSARSRGGAALRRRRRRPTSSPSACIAAG